MKFVKLLGGGQVQVVEESEPGPAPGEVLIKTAAAALCGSELHGYRGGGAKSGNSGHEAAGTVVRFGEDVDGLKVGQRVGVSAVAGCGECSYCELGQYTWCEKRKFYGKMHAEYFVVAANACHVLPSEVSWDVGVLLTGDGMGAPMHTARKIEMPDVKTVVVFGLGPIGLGNVLL
jgi:threonine dehydrogenase-like Zn-dependent dehydrogenase